MNLLRQALKPLRRPIYWAERRLYLANVFTASGLTLPSFLGLGAGQSGTTWLFDNLLRHPDVFVPSKKETHYFTREFNRWSLSYYASLFAPGAGRVCGEITPGYNVLRMDRIEFIHRLLPDARLILLIRNPVERAWSAARRHGSALAKSQGKRFEDLDDDLLFERFVTGWHARTRKYELHFEPGLLQSHYSAQIDRWLQFYPGDHLLVGFFDELQGNPRQLLERIFRHIGVRTEIDWDSMPMHAVVNKNPSSPIPERFRKYLQTMYEPEIDRLIQRFGTPAEAWRRTPD